MARILHSKGEDVRVLDIVDSPYRPNDVQFIECDVLDKQRLRSAMKDVDYVYHNVALVPLTKSGKRYRQVNIQGTENVLNQAMESNVKFFSHTSTSAMYAGCLDKVPIDENTSEKAIEIYGATKLEAEKKSS